MEFYSEQDKICADCFENSPNFRFLLTKSFEEEINKEAVVGFSTHAAFFTTFHAGTSDK